MRTHVIARSEATKQSMVPQAATWIARFARNDALARLPSPRAAAQHKSAYPSHAAEYFTAYQGPCNRPRNYPGRTKETSAENQLTIKGKAYIAGIFEHPTRHAPDKSTAQLHAEVARGAIEDAGLTKDDIDGYFCAGDASGGLWPMVDYLGLNTRKLSHVESTETGG